MPVRVGRGGLGAIAPVLAAPHFGADPTRFLGGSGPGLGAHPPGHQAELADFVSVVQAHTEHTWAELLQGSGAAYREPEPVLFSGSVGSACGYVQPAMGPFCCPEDRKVYIDLASYEKCGAGLGRRGTSPGRT
jgi:predicted metalloprotease